MTVVIPSSVAASAATGTTDRPAAASGEMCSSRFSLERLTATTVAPASATIRVTVVPMPPPPAPDTTTTRLSSLRRSDMRLFVRTTYDALHIEEHYSAAIIRSSRAPPTSQSLLSGLFELDNVRGHEHVAHRRPLPRAHSERRGGMAPGTPHSAQSAVRRQRPAHRPRRPPLYRAGDR